MKEEELMKFLVEEKGMNQDVIKSRINKFKIAKKKKKMTSIEAFFGKPERYV